ncbi:uncharacterized protein LOC123550716 [Mercenaria mercenaria]|uniref:uncharacterized protein LOC123550716 n=1 Tax=Mercenaria mercenaria TaxID=6596 RepID=UPI00234FACD8|nr:uncharacterized protein LOC123550716 [Mercenaria mercenaria]
MCFEFAAIVLGLTAIWVYVLRDWSFAFLAYAMFFPGVTALFMTAVNGRLMSFLSRLSGSAEPVRSLVFAVAAVVLVYCMVEACVVLAVRAGWAREAEIRKHSIHEHNKNRLSGFLRAAGEEIGWRCFLLPCLLDRYSVFTAFTISGIVWGLFHVPVMILLTYKLKPQRPYLTVLVQCVSCMLSAFPHGWVAVKSGYSMWACSVMHWFWNIYNPTVLGSIYTNTPGKYTGQQLLINGEGLTGCLVMLPVALAVVLDLNYQLLTVF